MFIVKSARILKVIRSYVHIKSGSIASYGSRMAQIPLTLNEHEGHFCCLKPF